jgi:hypothetical protein
MGWGAVKCSSRVRLLPPYLISRSPTNPPLSWIVGTLDSAWATVLKYHHLSNRSDKLKAFYTKWVKNLEWFGHNVLSTEHEETTAKCHRGCGGGASQHTRSDEIEAGKEKEADPPCAHAACAPYRP